MSKAGQEGELAGLSADYRSPDRPAASSSPDILAIGLIAAGSGRLAAKRPQIPALTGLRFFAAFFILIAHTTDWIAQFPGSQMLGGLSFPAICRDLASLAIYGMPLFFVLSGFVIHYNYRESFIIQSLPRAICEFAAARFARLYPLYFCVFLLAIAADSLPSELYNRPSLALPLLTYYLTLTQTWWYIVYDQKLVIFWIFAVSWSVSTEMYFYLVYAIIIFAMLAVCRQGRVFAVILAYTILVSGGIWLLYQNTYSILNWAEHYVPDYLPFPGKELNYSFLHWLLYISPYLEVLGFILGCLSAEAFLSVMHKKISSKERLFGGFALVISIGYLVACGLICTGNIGSPLMRGAAGFFSNNFLCAPAIAVILFCVARYDSLFARLMASRGLVALGETSYSIYLVHTFTLRLFERQPQPFTPFWAADTAWRMLCAIGFTFVVSYATYRLIEVPARDGVRRALRYGIALVFNRPRLKQKKHLMAVRSARTVKNGHAVYTASTLAFLPVLLLAGEAVRSEPLLDNLHRVARFDLPQIQLITASYGANGSGIHLLAPFPSTATVGNATKSARQMCNFGRR